MTWRDRLRTRRQRKRRREAAINAERLLIQARMRVALQQFDDAVRRLEAVR